MASREVDFTDILYRFSEQVLQQHQLTAGSAHVQCSTDRRGEQRAAYIKPHNLHSPKRIDRRRAPPIPRIRAPPRRQRRQIITPIRIKLPIRIRRNKRVFHRLLMDTRFSRKLQVQVFRLDIASEGRDDAEREDGEEGG